MMNSRPLLRNTLWNLAGQAAPLLVAVVAIPPLIRGLGADRFGMLGLVWVLIGYLSLFDLGLGRALTRSLAERLGSERREGLAELTWTALGLTFVLGLLGTLAALGLAAWAAETALRVPEGLRGEMRATLALLGWSLPVVLSTAGLRGVLEAHQRFGLVNAIRIPMAIYQFLAPLLVLPFSRRLDDVVVVLVAGRLAAWLAHLWAALAVMPELRGRPRFAPREMGALFREGGWMTVTNVVGPLLVYLDRFLLGAFASMRAVAYYVTPSEITSRLLVVPGAVSAALFPAFASDHRERPERAAHQLARGAAGTLVLLYPPVLLMSAFGPELMRAWIGATFAAHGTVVLRWLAVGVLINAVAHLPFTLLQAAGRSRLTALLHLAETPLYALGAWWAVRSAGAEGAAIAWTARVTVDAAALFVLARRRLGARAAPAAGWGRLMVLSLISLAAVDLTPGLAARAGLVLLALGLFAAAAWRWGLATDERRGLRAWLGSRP